MSRLIIFVKEVAAGSGRMPIGRRERAKKDKHERIMTAARELFAEQGVSGVATQQIADRADARGPRTPPSTPPPGSRCTASPPCSPTWPPSPPTASSPPPSLPAFTLITTPTPVQRRAFELLGVSHRLGHP